MMLHFVYYALQVITRLGSLTILGEEHQGTPLHPSQIIR
jgi:hypothetical protein